MVKIPNIGLNKDEKSIFVLVKFKCLTLGKSDMFAKHEVLFSKKFWIFKFLSQAWVYLREVTSRFYTSIGPHLLKPDDQFKQGGHLLKNYGSRRRKDGCWPLKMFLLPFFLLLPCCCYYCDIVWRLNRPVSSSNRLEEGFPPIFNHFCCTKVTCIHFNFSRCRTFGTRKIAQHVRI